MTSAPVIPIILPNLEKHVKHESYHLCKGVFGTIPFVDKSTKSALAALADNLKLLMNGHPELTSGPAIQRATGLSPSNITRIKNQQVAVGIDMLDTLAGAFGLEPWELLVPDEETREAVKAVREIQRKKKP